MTLNEKDYRSKIRGCWMGKNIGGTLGAPMEFLRQVNNVSFYQQKLTGEPLPNDDLDIQLLWLVALEEQGLDLNAQTLADYWCLYVTPHWSEYGTAKANMRSGLLPPLSGTYQNAYRHSCGAFIRSEIWACIAPGQPRLATQYALQDAILDHGHGEGTYGEVFCTALEAAAFINSDLRELIKVGLSYIPAECGIARAVRCAVDCIDRKLDWRAARDVILEQHRGSTCLGDLKRTSLEDQAKGFHIGVQGYDAPSNIAILVYGLLYGGDDFDRMICTTVNIGEDTDCTAATAGAIFGIIHGIGAIPERWIKPIGHSIKTACLNLGELALGQQLPQTIEELSERTERVMRHLASRPNRHRDNGELYRGLTGNTFRFPFLTVDVDYGDDPGLRNGEPKTLRITLREPYKVQSNVSLHWYLPAELTIQPADTCLVQCLPAVLGPPVTVEFTLLANQVYRAITRAVLELTVEGRPTVMTVPITLLNGNVRTEVS